MLHWSAERNVALHFIAPGKPTRNANIESLETGAYVVSVGEFFVEAYAYWYQQNASGFASDGWSAAVSAEYEGIGASLDITDHKDSSPHWLKTSGHPHGEPSVGTIGDIEEPCWQQQSAGAWG